MRFIIAFTFLCIALFSVNSSNKLPEDTVYTYVEQMPRFPGGEAEMMKYVANNLKYPSIKFDEHRFSSTCIVKFIVRQSGKITDVTIIRSINNEFDNEVIKLIELMPEWEPAINNGEKVCCYYTMPIRIHIK